MTEFDPDFKVDNGALALFSQYLGINDVDQIRRHILETTKKLKTSERTYRCLREYKFTAPRLAPRFYYQDILEDRQKRAQNGENPTLMDIGCCLGTDIRQLILDGYPGTSIVGVDLYRHFIDIGYDLFKDKDTLDVKFISGNIFDDHFLSPSDDIETAPLDQYKHQITYLNAGSVLHLFDGEQIRNFIRRAALLMKPGGWFVGAHVGGNRTAQYQRLLQGDIKHFESADDLTTVLEDAGFTHIDMRATQRLDESRTDEGFVALWLTFKAVYRPSNN
ncbi:hypothetical protein K450DRAFT_296820 [Umbelopsis ramanniana AG]|uniref:Methyltransferase domain-containing protein n=1 Tax=Umbelopsis ramanniana AG TaxID=1314678 RepID=A0AAD5EJH2_UMBRA|nr:uncharacterized protein K450DRAFT_296820 [Umbelopsis ramanniana AG]KAI8584081.1 hypothetical protein K450DRAFT_296820 [Umbelopsis ramanniana AG]